MELEIYLVFYWLMGGMATLLVLCLLAMWWFNQ